MAFILQLLDAPHVTDADSAEAFIDEQYELPPADNPKFAAFVREICQIYPDLSEEDDDGDNDANLWEEGIDEAATFGNVKQLVVKVDLADEAMLAALITAAVNNGLKLYDEEGEVVYPEQGEP